ncbi:MAG: TonB family protein [Candidatus Zapsychrus exili]|nr:TonB family protein [Candidatus Zapsychrus exili]
MKKYSISKKSILSIMCMSLLLMTCIATSFALAEDAAETKETIDTLGIAEISMIKGELDTLKVYSLTRVSLTDPSVADIVDANANEILLIAKEEGQTALFIWDKHGKRTLAVNVFNQHLESIKGRLEDLLDSAGISGIVVEVNKKEGKVIVVGDINEEQQEHFDKIIAPFDRDLILLTREEKAEDLIQIDLQITELITTLSETIGVDWSAGDENSVVLTYAENMPTFNQGGVQDIVKVGAFNRTSALLATVNALVSEGKARILSQPKLVVVSGEEASFLVGGEIPVRTTTVNDDGTAENIEYKEYGIGMTIQPTIRKEKIDIILDTEISDIDGSSPAGADDVAFLTRAAQTQLYLEDGQTIVIAGLIKSNKNESRTSVPFFSKIPVLGLLFRSRSNPAANQDTEIVISLTPHILVEEKRKEVVVDEIKEIVRREEIITIINNVLEEEIVEIDEVVEETEGMENVAENAEAANKGTIYTEEATELEEVEAIIEEEKEAEEVDLFFLADDDSVPIDEKPYQAPENDYILEGIPEEMQNYVKGVQQAIFESISYPIEAENYGWEGMVKLGMLILDDGTLAFALVKESSGYEVFDNNALETAKNLAPYPAFPSDTDLMELSVTIPIVYSLDSK